MKASRLIYASYFYFVCLYVIFIRLQAVPVGLSYLLYGLSVILGGAALLSRGMSKWEKKQDLLFIGVFFFYYFFSGIIYITGASDISWLFKDYIYALLPILFYILVRSSQLRLNEQTILFLTWVSIIIIDVLSVLMYVNVGFNVSGFFRQESLEYEGAIDIALSGVVGVMLTGFINVIGIVICVFSPIKLNSVLKIVSVLLFIICIFLTGQRTPIGGIAIVALVYFFQKKIKGLVLLVIAAGVLVFTFSALDIEIEGISVNDVLFERTLSRFDNVKGGETGRNDQYRIYNDDNLFEFILGEGVGAHSPENPKCQTPMPDAMLFRIFNEMGVVGLFSFLLFFLINTIRAIKTRNWFMLSLIAYMFLANATNRVLFFAPLSILPFFLLAFFNWRNVDKEKILKE